MAKATGPLFSLSARGSINKGQLTFSQSPGFHRVFSCRFRKPPPAAVAAAAQDAMILISALWAELPVMYRAYWSYAAYPSPTHTQFPTMRAPLSGRLLYIQWNLARVRAGERPFIHPRFHLLQAKRHELPVQSFDFVY